MSSHHTEMDGAWSKPDHLPGSVENGQEGDTQEAVTDQVADSFANSGKI